MLAGAGAFRALTTVTAVGWLIGRWWPFQGERVAALFFGPLLLLPQVIAGCIVRMEYPDKGIPGGALLLAGYLVFALTLFVCFAREEYAGERP